MPFRRKPEFEIDQTVDPAWFGDDTDNTTPVEEQSTSIAEQQAKRRARLAAIGQSALNGAIVSGLTSVANVEVTHYPTLAIAVPINIVIGVGWALETYRRRIGQWYAEQAAIELPPEPGRIDGPDQPPANDFPTS